MLHGIINQSLHGSVPPTSATAFREDDADIDLDSLVYPVPGPRLKGVENVPLPSALKRIYQIDKISVPAKRIVRVLSASGSRKNEA